MTIIRTRQTVVITRLQRLSRNEPTEGKLNCLFTRFGTYAHDYNVLRINPKMISIGYALGY